MDTFFSIEGVRTSQSIFVPNIFSKILMDFDIIIEIGTFTGAFTKWISENTGSECKIISFDINPDYREFQKNDRNIDRTTFVVGDVFSNENIDIIKNLIRSENKRVLVLCDGGLKEKEFSIFSKFLKINDVIMLHDYSENEEEYNRITTKINWPTPSESHYENIKNDVIKNGLEPYNYNDFKGVLWGSFIKSRPKVSVVVPAYKFSKFLEVNLITILSQKTDFEYEVIVRDDFSNDGSDKILLRLKSLYPNLIVHNATENWGVHRNIKFLLEQARGEYIAYLDGDDYYVDPYKLQKQVDFLDQNPEYVMYGTGYCILRGENEYIPGDGASTFWSLIEDVRTEDLFEHNYVGFGRVFRNIKGIYKDYMDELPYLDYAINYELSLHGLIKNDNWYGGVYREHFGGTLTSLSDDEKEKTHNMMKNLLKNRYENYNKMKKKPITIIDCFVHSEEIEVKLIEFINNLKNNGHDIFLISNTTVKQTIVDSVDYYFYNNRNLLFSEDKFEGESFKLWKVDDNIEIHEILFSIQRHGLSVLSNLFTALKISLQLGYSHFQRIEVDTIISEKGMKFIDGVPLLCHDNNKKGLFYFNDDDISFHYFYCEIDEFLKSVEEINNDEDYLRYLERNFGSNKFITVERFVRQNFDDNSKKLLIKTGLDMYSDFDGTKWNTITSESSVNSIYNGCTTEFYIVYNSHMEEVDSVGILTYNYTDRYVNRDIIVFLEDGSKDFINHKLDTKNAWTYNLYPKNTLKIEVYEDGNCIFVKENKNIKSYIVLK